ncbi:MAG: NAD(P)-dependent oxidoreductase [archaeon]|nr:hydroxyacid dehydrogenase [Nanoarchaeota archaeon]
MKIGFFGVEEQQKEYFKIAFPKDKLYFCSDKLCIKNVTKFKNVDSISIFINSPVTESVINKLQNLKLITTRSTGFDHIDLNAAEKRKITVCNVPVYGENTVAEHAFALISCLSRRIPEALERTKKSFSPDGLRGFDLKDKTLGVIGTGNIGKNAIQIGKGFNMKVLAFDIYKDQKFAKQANFKYVTLEELLKKSDIITLHIPLNKHTFHLIDKKKISLMKRGTVLINTSRGPVIDTLAILPALKSGKLGGAGLDVLEEEAKLFRKVKFDQKTNKILKANLELIKMSNVLVTPHNAFNTKEAVRRIMETTVKNINGFKKGRKINVVKPFKKK